MIDNVQIIDLAKDLGWELVFHKPENCLVRLKRDEFRIDVWYTTGTIGIMRKHSEAHYLYNVSLEDLTEIMANPAFA